MKTNTFKKALSLILAVAMCFTVITVPVFAEDATDITTQRNKIYNLTTHIGGTVKTDNNGYETDEEAAKAVSYSYIIGENLSATSFRNNEARSGEYFNPSDDMLGATYIRAPRYYGSPAKQITTDGTGITKRVYDADGVTYTDTTGKKFGSGAADNSFRVFNVPEQNFYSGTDGWISFKVTSDCTVVIADFTDDLTTPKYPNAVADGWEVSDGKTNYAGGTSLYKHFNAGDIVDLPNYGLAGNIANTNKVEFLYKDTNGESQTYTTDVAHTVFSWHGVYVAIKWDNPISPDTTLASVTVGEIAADLSAMEDNTVTVTVPYGTTEADLTVVPNSDVATVDAPETVSVGETATFTVTAESGRVSTYYVNVVEAEFVFEVEVSATDEYKALFADGKYTGNHVIKASAAPTFTEGTQGIMSWDENGIAKNRTYTITVDDAAYAEDTTTVFSYAEAIAIKEAKEAEGSMVVLTASGWSYTSSKFTTLFSSSFNTSGHNFGPIGSAFRNADFQIMTHRAIAPGRVDKEVASFIAATEDLNGDSTVDTKDTTKSVQDWLRTDSNYLYTVTPNAKATVYVAFGSAASAVKDHAQYIADGWTFIDSSSYFTSARLNSLSDDAIIDGFETLPEGISRGWYMVEPSYIIEKAPYSLVKIQYDTGSNTQTTVYPYVWYKTVEAGVTVKIPTVGDCVTASDQQPIKGFVIQGEHAPWEPESTDTTLKTLSYEIDGALTGEIELAENTYEYDVTVPSNADEIKLTATANHEKATALVADADLSAEEKKATVTVTAEDGLTQKVYTINVNKASVPFINIASADSFISETNTFKVYDAVTNGLAHATATIEDETERVAKKAEYQAIIDNFNAAHGENAARGTSIWGSYPAVGNHSKNGVVVGAKLDNPMAFGIKSDAADFIADGDSWVFKSTKGATPQETNHYSFGKNDEYLTFEISKPGTMYVVITNGWGYKGGTDNGYTLVENYTLGGCSVYAKSFEAGKVTVPAQDYADIADNLGVKQTNSIGFVFMFDDESRADLTSIAYKVGDSENKISYIDRDTTSFDVKTTVAHNGEIEVSANGVMEGTTVTASGTLEAGYGIITVTSTSPDGSVTKDYTINFTGPSNDATLKSLKAGESEITLKEGTVAYEVEIAADATAVEVVAEANDENAAVAVTQADFAADNMTATVKVTAEDGLTVKEYTITFVKPQAKLVISTNGAKITASVNDGEEEDFGDNKTVVYNQGTKIKLTAVGGEGQEFMYWKETYSSNAANSTIVSESECYSFTAGTSRNLVAVFADKAAFTVSFRSNGKIIADGTAVDKVPANPYVAGYSFEGWYLAGTRTDLKAGDNVPEVEENTIYQAGFKKSDAKYTVTVYNGSETAQTLEKQYNDMVTLEAAQAPEGKVFKGWERDEAMVSYSTVYSFYVNADTTVKAVYSEEAVEVPDVVVTLAKPAQITGELKLAYYAERNVADGLEVVETGILLDTDADFGVSTAKIKAIAKSTSNVGQYTIRKANVTPGEEWYGKAYVIYKKDGETKVAYSALIGPDTTVAVD